MHDLDFDVIDGSMVHEVLQYRECINILKDMFMEASNEIDSQPRRTIISAGSESVILVMPSFSQRIKKFAVKIVTEFKENPEKFGLPAQGGKIVLMDGDNGKTLAIIDSSSVTEIRTASMCALATDILARKDSEQVCIIGSGREARAILEAILCVRDINRVRVKSRNYSNAVRYAEEMGRKLGIELIPCKETSEASRGADIIVTATNSEAPVLYLQDVERGAHIVSIGTLPTRRELGDDLISSSSVFVDTRAGVLNEAGDIMHAIREGMFSPERIKADLSELVTGKHKGRESKEEITLFKSVGFALLDVFAASVIFEKVKQLTR